MANRPSHLPPGSLLARHYVIEGLVRLSEGRMFYLANDNRPDQPTRHCWACRGDASPRTAVKCADCGEEFRDRRFLISARWDEELFDGYQSFASKKLEHPGLTPPVDVFQHEGLLFSVVEYNGEGLMLDEAAPLENARLFEVGQRVLGTIAFLRHHGVRICGVTRANILIHTDNSISLFDLDIEETSPGPIKEGFRELRSFAELLRRYSNVEADELRTSFIEIEEERRRPTLIEFGRLVEASFADFGSVRHAPLVGGMSDVGLVRQLNEDNWGWIRLSDRAKLYIVADGMGGHDSGEVASMMAVKVMCEESLRRELSEHPDLDAMELLVEESFRLANNAIKDEADSKGTDMGTTMVCILVVDDRIGFMANVGDSRGYLMRQGALHQISRDHSLVQKMVERGRITADEARRHPHSNILLRTVGTERDVEVDVFRIELEPGDKVMMCSDGLWGEVEDRDIENLMNTYADPRIASRALVRAAHHGGGKDNVTLVIVGIGEPSGPSAPLSPPPAAPRGSEEPGSLVISDANPADYCTAHGASSLFGAFVRGDLSNTDAHGPGEPATWFRSHAFSTSLSWWERMKAQKMVVLFGGEADFEAADILSGELQIRYWETGFYNKLPDGQTADVWLENRVLTEVEKGLGVFVDARARGEHTGKDERNWIRSFLTQLLIFSDARDKRWLRGWWDQQAWASEHPYEALMNAV